MSNNPYHELQLQSEDYWCGVRGRQDAPPPTYREIKGQMVLGRYMDPYGCEALMQNQKHLWSKWYTTFLLAAGTSAVLGVDAVFIFAVLPVFAVWYLGVRHNRRAKYDKYWAIQQRCLKSGQPEWVPFDRERMKSLSKTPLAVWP
jgi:hypothetical protein